MLEFVSAMAQFCGGVALIVWIILTTGRIYTLEKRLIRLEDQGTRHVV
jgi:hypothetical protein